MRFRKRSTGDSLDTDSAFSDDASSMLSSESSSTSSVNGGRPQQVLFSALSYYRISAFFAAPEEGQKKRLRHRPRLVSFRVDIKAVSG